MTALLFTPFLLAASPPPSPTDFAAEIDHVGFVSGEELVELIAYDGEGKVVASLTLWLEPDESILLLSEYADGLARFTIAPDDAVGFDSTLARELIERRAEALLTRLEDYPGPLEDHLSCALAVADSVVSCAAESGSCPLISVSAACDCLPRKVEEWDGRVCPGSA